MIERSQLTKAEKRILLATYLKKGEVQFQQLLDKLPAGAYTCDREGLITYFNQHAVQIWGREPSLNDAVDRFCGSFKLFSIEGEPMQHDDCWMARALKQNREFNGFEIIIEQPDGKKLMALAHANPIHDESGNLLGAVNVLVDITEMKLAEDILKKSNRAKNEFIATLAHELRNPLSPIRNAIKVLQLHGNDSPEANWAIDIIDRQTTQLTRLVDDLMDVARINSNKLEICRERIELAEILDSASEVSRPFLEKRGQKFSINYPKDKIYLQGDLTRLTQVVANLLNNAAKYTERGGSITLSGEIREDKAQISVKDNGIGIASDVLSGIFEMFAQAERALEKSDEGLGIGLTLANRLVQMHGGTLEARSEGINKGSTFIVKLPVEAETLEEISQREVEKSAKSEAKGTRILVVDDNKDCAESLGMLLSMLGKDVRQAFNGFEAIEAVEEFQPQVVFLDIGMPKMDGYETARRLREKDAGKDIMLIALTGWGQDEDRHRSKEAGFDHHLTKPLDFDDLESLLAESGF